MELTEQENAIKNLIDKARTVVIVQADNPDGDSLGSTLALEHILDSLGKETILYCGVDIPVYLRHLSGWDRVQNEIPKTFDASIVVDCSSINLLEVANRKQELPWLLAKPLVILDHHDVEPTILTNYRYYTPAVATGELIYQLANKFNWKINTEAKSMLAVAILSDSLGLMSEATSPTTFRIMADLVEAGVKLPELEEARRETMRKSVELVRYKGELLQRIEYFSNDRVATITIPHDEIETYSQQYNPSVLVLDDMRLTNNVAVAVAFKVYKDGKITGKIRCNYKKPIANDLAAAFGGGGHPYASGFKITDKTPPETVKQRVIDKATELLDKLQ